VQVSLRWAIKCVRIRHVKLDHHNKNKMDYEERKQFLDFLPRLSKPQYEQMFRILKASGGEYTENSNGIFFDIAKLNDECFNKLNDYMKYCMLQRIEEETRVKELEGLRASSELLNISKA
jgi:hypothetical protein